MYTKKWPEVFECTLSRNLLICTCMSPILIMKINLHVRGLEISELCQESFLIIPIMSLDHDY